MHGLGTVGTSDEVVGGWLRERLSSELTDGAFLIGVVSGVPDERDGGRADAREEEDDHPAAPEAGSRWRGR